IDRLGPKIWHLHPPTIRLFALDKYQLVIFIFQMRAIYDIGRLRNQRRIALTIVIAVNKAPYHLRDEHSRLFHRIKGGIKLIKTYRATLVRHSRIPGQLTGFITKKTIWNSIGIARRL